ncbi:MAG: ankyrin repeat domain-containing protein [Candidatus Marsarchaeota archaeon]|nr:ankyrin repeat domain-containing protein [Candidatus Marsarchaeota archaeon]
MNRRAIDVKLFVQDVQEGASHASLMEKYDLTREQLDEALDILANAGKLPRSALIPDTSQPSESAHPVASTCQRCGALILADSGDCPQCLQNEVARLIDEKEVVAKASGEEHPPARKEDVEALEFDVADLEGPPSQHVALPKPASRPKRRWLPAVAGISFVAVILAAGLFYFGTPDFLLELWPTQPEKPWPAPVQISAPKVASAPKMSESSNIPSVKEEPSASDTHTNSPVNREISKEDASAERFFSQSPGTTAEEHQELTAAKGPEVILPESASVPSPESSGQPEPVVQDRTEVASEPQEPDEAVVPRSADAPPEPQYASVSPQTISQPETPEKRDDASTPSDEINSLLVKAIKEGSLDQAKSLIDRGGDVNAEDEQGSSLLALAVKLDNERMVDFLIKRGADRSRKDKGGFTPLARACEAANGQIAELLLAGDESKGASTLFEACEKGRIRWAKLLLEHGADMNARNQQGATPLMVAAGNGQEPLVELLLGKGADTGALDNKGYTALAWAYSPTAMNVTPFPVQRKIIRLLKHHSPSAVSLPGSGN